MKPYLLVFLAFITPVFANKVQDGGNLLHGRADELNTYIGNRPVWVITLESAPSNLRADADAMAQTANSGKPAFVIILAPHRWRISVYPMGLVSGEKTRYVGDRMVQNFKLGDFYGGLSHAVDDLERLLEASSGAAVAESEPTPIPTVEAPATSTTYQSAVIPQKDGDGFGWLFFVLLLVPLAALGTIIYVVYKRRHHLVAPSVDEPSMDLTPTVFAHADASSAQRANARMVFNSYTPEQRTAIVNNYPSSPYASSALSDYFMFYLLLNEVNRHDEIVLPPSYTPPAPASYTTPATPSSYTPPEPAPYSPPSSSDSSGSSGSWSSPDTSSSSFSSDSSSSSSFDSGSSSSSDSGGSSGSF